MAQTAHAPTSSIGSLLQYWRKARNLSQLALANEAEVSARHVSFLETGRAKPSRDMVLLLADVLDVPFRERNALLLAAGFAPLYREASLDAPELASVRAAIEAIIRQQEPFPAVVMNRHWDIVNVNGAAERFFALLLGDAPPGNANVLRLMFDPNGLRPYVDNWQAVAETLVQRAHRESVGGVMDQSTADLIEELLAYPGVPRRFARVNLQASPLPVIPVRFKKNDAVFEFFSTITMLGSPQDIALQEVRIECFFPTDGETERTMRKLSGAT